MTSEADSSKIAVIKQKSIFLSHAAKDKTLADKISDLLTSGCAVNPNDILCTSLEGKGIPTGAQSFIDFLHGQIKEPKLVILVLSENFFMSQFCMCELGAVWGMKLMNFPLVVPPVERGKLKAVLTVAQAGEITNPASLDELRDVVKINLGTEVPTATWTVKRDAFLASLNGVIESLEKPGMVSKEELKAVKEQYQAALEEIGNKEKEVDVLKTQISDLEKCKNRDEVRAVNRNYSTEQQQFERLVEESKSALRKLRNATAKAIFHKQRGDNYVWDGKDEWHDVQEAEKVQEVEIFDGYTRYCTPRDEHIRVQKAHGSLRELSEFLNNEDHFDFVIKLEEEREFPINLKNKEFWQHFLGLYV